MKRQTATTLVLGTLLSAGLVLTGCTGAPAPEDGDFSLEDASWDEIVEEANREGQVTLYLAMSNYEPRIDGFRAAYPDIELTIVREVSADLITKLLAERDADIAGGDVTMLSDYTFFANNEADLETAHAPSAELYRDIDPEGGENYFTTTAVPFTLLSNTEVLEEIGADPLETWEDALQPELQGLIGLTNPDITPVEVQFYSVLNENLGTDYLQALKDLGARIGETSGSLAQSVAAGDLAASFGGVTVTSAPLEEQGAPLDVQVQTDPAFVIGYATGIPNWTKHPAAAQVLLEWMISPEGQESQHEWGKSTSILPDLDIPLKLKIEKIYTGVLTDEQKAFHEDIWKPMFG